MLYKIDNRYIIDAKSPLSAINRFTTVIKNEASIKETIKALIVDEESAIDSYEIAIKNLSNKMSTEQLNLLKHILDEEKEHVEELQSIINELEYEEVE